MSEGADTRWRKNSKMRKRACIRGRRRVLLSDFNASNGRADSARKCIRRGHAFPDLSCNPLPFALLCVCLCGLLVHFCLLQFCPIVLGFVTHVSKPVRTYVQPRPAPHGGSTNFVGLLARSASYSTNQAVARPSRPAHTTERQPFWTTICEKGLLENYGRDGLRSKLKKASQSIRADPIDRSWPSFVFRFGFTCARRVGGWVPDQSTPAPDHPQKPGSDGGSTTFPSLYH